MLLRKCLDFKSSFAFHFTCKNKLPMVLIVKHKPTNLFFPFLSHCTDHFLFTENFNIGVIRTAEEIYNFNIHWEIQ